MSEAVGQTEAVSLTLPADERFITVARLLVGGIGARLEMSYEELDDLQLVTELLLVTLVKEGADNPLGLDVAWDEAQLVLVAGPSARSVTELGGDAELRRLLAALGAELEIEPRSDGTVLRAVRAVSVR